jgi:hypothetical protein
MRKPARGSRLELLLAMTACAGMIAARGGSCTACPPSYTHVIPLLPPSSNGGPGGPVDTAAACEQLCAGALDCQLDTANVDGGAVPVVICTMSISCDG